MMARIGILRFIAMIVLTFLIGWGLFYTFVTKDIQYQTLEKRANLVRSDLNQLTSDTQILTQGIEAFGEQRETFTRLKENGFFNNQNRVEAYRLTERVEQESEVLSARYSLKPLEEITDLELERAQSSILKSSFEIRVNALSDIDIYRYIYLLQGAYPGQILFDSVEIVKNEELTQPLLRNIGTRTDVKPLLTAILTGSWYTYRYEGDTSMASQTLMNSQGEGAF